MTLEDQLIMNNRHIEVLQTMLVKESFFTKRFHDILQMINECMKDREFIECQIRKEKRNAI